MAKGGKEENDTKILIGPELERMSQLFQASRILILKGSIADECRQKQQYRLSKPFVEWIKPRPGVLLLFFQAMLHCLMSSTNAFNVTPSSGNVNNNNKSNKNRAVCAG